MASNIAAKLQWFATPPHFMQGKQGIILNLKQIMSGVLYSKVLPYWERIKASPIGYRLASGAFWSLLGTIVSRIFALSASIIAARMLGKVGFGELGIIQNTVGMFGTFAGFGLGLTATKYIAEFRYKDPAKAGRIISLLNVIAIYSGAFFSVILYYITPWLSIHTLAAPHLSGYLQVGSLLLFLGALNGVQTGVLSGFEAFRSVAVVSFWTGILSFIFTAGGIYWKGLYGGVWGLVAGMGVNCALNHLAVRKEMTGCSISYSFSTYWNERKILWNYSFPSVLGNSLVVPVSWVCSAILVQQPNGYAEMGIYNAANQWLGAFGLITGAFLQAAVPLFSRTLAENNIYRARKILNATTKWSCVAAFPLVFVGLLASPYIMALYGPDFKSSWMVLFVVILTAGVIAAQTFSGAVLQAADRMWVVFFMYLGWGLCYTAVTVLLIQHGALALVTGRLCAFTLHGAWTIAFARLLTKANSGYPIESV